MMNNPFRYFNSSPEVIRRAVLKPPMIRSLSTRPRGARRSSSHRPGRRTSLGTAWVAYAGSDDLTLAKTLGRRRWKQASGCPRQGRVENTFFRYKSIIEMAFAPGVQLGRGVRPSSAVRSSIG